MSELERNAFLLLENLSKRDDFVMVHPTELKMLLEAFQQMRRQVNSARDILGFVAERDLA